MTKKELIDRLEKLNPKFSKAAIENLLDDLAATAIEELD